MTRQIKILMVEDSPSLSAVYEAYLENTDYTVATAATLGEAHMRLHAVQPDIVLLDIELPDGNGMDFIEETQGLGQPPQVVVMTAHGTSGMAVEAIRRGAFDFLTKPFDGPRLRVTLKNAIEQLQLNQQASELADLQRDGYGEFIGRSMAMQSVYRTIDSLASSDATGFIIGESGTGKELAAEAIHRHSPRRHKEFVAINCGAIPGELMESELFGHVKGAFTGASNNREGAATLADGGTLFLDEICEMDLDLQKKLLRFIQTGTFRRVGSNKLEKVNIRFVCATNRDPLEEVREGRFREDLFYRLHVVPVRMPALREREDDMLLIAQHFLDGFAQQEGSSFNGFDEAAEQALRRYPWPGNVRQLQNSIHQTVVLNDGEIITEAMLPESVRAGHLDNHDGSSARSMSAHITRRETIEPLWLTEKRAIEAAIDTCDGNINRAAGLLEVAPSTIYRKLQSWKAVSA